MADRDELTFEQIEDALPDGEMLPDGRMAVSAQQLHDFARVVSRAPIQPVATQEDAGKVPVAQMSGDRAATLSEVIRLVEKCEFDEDVREYIPGNPSYEVDRLTKQLMNLKSAAITASHPSNAVQDAPKPVMELFKIADQMQNDLHTGYANWLRRVAHQITAATVPQVVQAPIPDSRPLHVTAQQADEPKVIGALGGATYWFRVGWNAYRNALLTTASNAGEAKQGEES